MPWSLEFLHLGGIMSSLCLKAIASICMLIDHAVTARLITQPLLMEVFHLSLAESYPFMRWSCSGACLSPSFPF